jgi:hypothetical protein
MPDEVVTPPEVITPPASDIEKLNGALKSERELYKESQKQLKAIQAQLDAYSGIAPEMAQKAKEILAQQEEFAQRESKIRADVEATFTPKIKELEQVKESAERSLRHYKRDAMLEREYTKANGFPGEFDDVAKRLQGRVAIDPVTEEVKVLDKLGKPSFTKGEPTTIADLIAELKTDHLGFARHFKGSEGAGAGMNGNGRFASNDPSLAGLSAWEKVDRMRAGNL